MQRGGAVQCGQKRTSMGSTRYGIEEKGVQEGGRRVGRGPERCMKGRCGGAAQNSPSCKLENSKGGAERHTTQMPGGRGRGRGPAM